MGMRFLFKLFIIFGILFLLIYLCIRIFTNTKQDTAKDLGGKSQSVNGSIEKERMKVIGWIPYWDQENAKKSFMNNADKLDFVSVFWYRLEPDGSVGTYTDTVEDEEILKVAKKEKVKVLALVANLPDHTENGDWDYRRVDKVIATKAARDKHIKILVDLVKSKDFDGLDIDYEALKRPQRENFSLFIEELADALHSEGKILGVAIHPKTDEYKPEEDNGSHAQNLNRIANAADQLYFMTYLEHGKFSAPGSSGSVPWIENVMRYGIEGLDLPKEKVFMGVGVFGLEWEKDRNDKYTGTRDDLTFGEIVDRVNEKGVKEQYDDYAKSFHFSYTEKGIEHTIWYENAHSIEEKIKLAERLGVGGLALWRLNSEDPAMWELLSDK